MIKSLKSFFQMARLKEDPMGLEVGDFLQIQKEEVEAPQSG